jgi:hypothetical protein
MSFAPSSRNGEGSLVRGIGGMMMMMMMMMMTMMGRRSTQQKGRVNAHGGR